VEKDKAKDIPSYPVSFENDPGSSNSGYYELRAVLTHKGRSSDSGHYVAWVKTDEGGCCRVPPYLFLAWSPSLFWHGHLLLLLLLTFFAASFQTRQVGVA
jgi:hypothetical protein